MENRNETERYRDNNKKGAFFHVWKKSKEKQNVKYSLFYSYTILIIIRR